MAKVKWEAAGRVFRSGLKKHYILLTLFILSVPAGKSDPLELDFQSVHYGSSNITIGVMYSGNCVVRGETFQKTSIVAYEFAEPDEEFNAVNDKIGIPMEEFGVDDENPTFIRLVARNSSDICSDTSSQVTFYRFMSKGMNNSNVTDIAIIPIPQEGLCANPAFIWPQNKDFRQGKNCKCLPIEEESINYRYSFRDCAEKCNTKHDVSISNDGVSIVFRNLQINPKNFMAHFVCDQDPCDDDTCFMESVVMSHHIIVIPSGAAKVGIRPVMLYGTILLSYALAITA